MRKKVEVRSSGLKASTTTTSVLEPVAETNVETIKKVEEKKEQKDFLNYCALCNKKLEAFVAANGLKFCNDDCLKEFFKK